ncbi:MAG: hypothetical protein GYB21_03010 [Oceanospirillales bacterium]|nr:hypothetical protein [Oceanospirillales bacterium]
MKPIAYIAPLLLCSAMASADECRDKFVACVQNTGNPGTCQSTYQQCKAPVKAPAPEESQGDALSLEPRMSQLNGLDTVELWVANTGKVPVQIGDVSYDIRCADGTTQTAYFELGGMVGPNAERQRVGFPQVICADAGGAVAMLEGKEAPDTGSASLAAQIIYYLPCANGTTQTLTLEYKQPGFYQWQSTSGITGRFPTKTLINSDMVAMACSPESPPQPNRMQQVLEELNRLLNDHSQGTPVPTKSTTTGVRG